MSRPYAKILPRRWTGTTGRAIRGDFEAMSLMDYLFSCQHSNMLGLYYLPLDYLVIDLGIRGSEGALNALRRLETVGFCRYDEKSEVVWVINMARDQIGGRLKATDKQCAGVQNQYDALPNNPFLGDFFDHYVEDYHLTDRRDGGQNSEDPSKAHARPSQGPPKGLPDGEKTLRSQELDQDQDQEIDQEQEQQAPLAGEPVASRLKLKAVLQREGWALEVGGLDIRRCAAIAKASPITDAELEEAVSAARERSIKPSNAAGWMLARIAGRREDAERAPADTARRPHDPTDGGRIGYDRGEDNDHQEGRYDFGNTPG